MASSKVLKTLLVWSTALSDTSYFGLSFTPTNRKNIRNNVIFNKHNLDFQEYHQYSFEPTAKCCMELSMSESDDAAVADTWHGLVEVKSSTSSLSSPVKKKILEVGTGPIPTKGSQVTINYVGTLQSQQSWSVEDVIDCWLQNQQGLYDVLCTPFRENQVDGTKLMDETIFTEQFVADVLGVTNKLQCKKAVMAAKRLGKQKEEFPEGTEFDSRRDDKIYSFLLGQGKAIKAMDLAVSTMKVGERAEIVCRADYAYGSEGYRRTTGEVIVPPFATLCFDVKLLSFDK